MEEEKSVLKLGYRVTQLLRGGIYSCFTNSTSPHISVKNADGHGRTEVLISGRNYGYGTRHGVHLEGPLNSKSLSSLHQQTLKVDT